MESNRPVVRPDVHDRIKQGIRKLRKSLNRLEYPIPPHCSINPKDRRRQYEDIGQFVRLLAENLKESGQSGLAERAQPFIDASRELLEVPETTGTDRDETFRSVENHLDAFEECILKECLISQYTDPTLRDLTWYTLDIFGCRAGTPLVDEPQFRYDVRTLAVRLRAAAAKAELVAGGANNETVYLAVCDWLVGEFKLSATEADQTSVARIIEPLSHIRSKPDPVTPTKRLAKEELLARALFIILKDPQITPIQLATKLNVTRSTLYRKSPRWQPILAALKQASTGEIPVGYKSADGGIEAWSRLSPKSAQTD